MSTAAKLAASTETVKENKTSADANGVKSLKAKTANDYSAREEEQRRKWGVEKAALRSTHARKF